MQYTLYKEKCSMSKLLLAISLVLLSTTMAFAQGTKISVVGTVHDIKDDGTSVCLNCHTPHKGRTDAPLLWALVKSPTSFATYDSGGILNDTRTGTVATNPTLTDPVFQSFLCMSCHDSATISSEAGFLDQPATAAYVAASAVSAGGLAATTTFGSTALTSDHPVNIIFSDTVNPALNTIASVTGGTNKLKLFAESTGTEVTVQCATCHDPHEANYDKSTITAPGDPSPNILTESVRTFFLRNQLSNGQDLCLACHK